MLIDCWLQHSQSLKNGATPLAIDWLLLRAVNPLDLACAILEGHTLLQKGEWIVDVSYVEAMFLLPVSRRWALTFASGVTNTSSTDSSRNCPLPTSIHEINAWSSIVPFIPTRSYWAPQPVSSEICHRNPAGAECSVPACATGSQKSTSHNQSEKMVLHGVLTSL